VQALMLQVLNNPKFPKGHVQKLCQYASADARKASVGRARIDLLVRHLDKQLADQRAQREEAGACARAMLAWLIKGVPLCRQHAARRRAPVWVRRLCVPNHGALINPHALLLCAERAKAAAEAEAAAAAAAAAAEQAAAQAAAEAAVAKLAAAEAGTADGADDAPMPQAGTASSPPPSADMEVDGQPPHPAADEAAPHHQQGQHAAPPAAADDEDEEEWNLDL
jgi:hypothetical protein